MTYIFKSSFKKLLFKYGSDLNYANTVLGAKKKEKKSNINDEANG